MEVWGGVECTLNRVHDRYFDQHEWSGHRRLICEDLEKIASLGIRTLRTALHWEYFSAGESWDFFDRLLGEMRRLRLTPIAGLVHHGSGPFGTHLLDSDFPTRLASYAGSVARRYPWIKHYTPVNEPHTTARFACLYGHWYPHHLSLHSYVRALLNEIKGTVLAMRAVQQVQPDAQLIYTEDGGSTFAVEELESFRVEREHRRWLGTDLLCGSVDASHPLYPFLLKNGITADEIAWFQDNPFPPTVLGFNYYPTSDRFLDPRLHLYPKGFPGGDSGREPLVDIEAIRVRPAGIAGVGPVLRDAWDRYRIPVAVTEAHLGGNCDDQIRWLHEIWTDALCARASGVDVRAVTVWALLGSWNWPNLCTRDESFYEPGVFDIRNGHRHRTPLADFVEQLTSGNVTERPFDRVAPWWHRPDRIIYEGVEELAAAG